MARSDTEVERLRENLRRAQAVANQVMNRAEQILTQRSGVPRGKWAYVRGTYETAKLIASVLGDD